MTKAKRRPGRPRIQGRGRRDESVHLRCTAEELRALQGAAHRRQISVAEFVRECSLSMATLGALEEADRLVGAWGQRMTERNVRAPGQPEMSSYDRHLQVRVDILKIETARELMKEARALEKERRDHEEKLAKQATEAAARVAGSKRETRRLTVVPRDPKRA